MLHGPLAEFKGPTSNGRERKEGEGKERGNGEMRLREREGRREGKRKGNLPPLKFRSGYATGLFITGRRLPWFSPIPGILTTSICKQKILNLYLRTCILRY